MMPIKLGSSPPGAVVTGAGAGAGADVDGGGADVVTTGSGVGVVAGGGFERTAEEVAAGRGATRVARLGRAEADSAGRTD